MEADRTDAEDTVLARRGKYVTMEWTPDKTFRVTTLLADNNHEMELVGIFSHPDLEILELRVRMIRCPHAECQETTETLQAMVGQRVKPGLMKQAFAAVANRGCVHLTNLFKETIEAALFARGKRVRRLLAELRPNLTELETYKFSLLFRPELLDMCNAYREGSTFLESVRETAFPEGLDFRTIQELEEFYEAAKGTPVKKP